MPKRSGGGGSGASDGRSHRPFTTLSAAGSAAGNANGDYIFVHQGSGTTTGGITLKPSQILGAGTEQGIDWKVNMGVAVLLMLVVISAIAVALFLVVPLLFSKQARHGAKWLPLIYFIAIGLGYIAVEITLIQRLVLFLGHPIYAMTVVVFLMLLSSGAGSMASPPGRP